MAKAAFPEPKDLVVPLSERIGDGTPPVNPNPWTVSNPHPGYMKDPNILNCYGHAVYPKMIYPQGQAHPGIIVNSKAEEASYYKPEEEKAPAPAASNGGWGSPAK